MAISRTSAQLGWHFSAHARTIGHIWNVLFETSSDICRCQNTMKTQISLVSMMWLAVSLTVGQIRKQTFGILLVYQLNLEITLRHPPRYLESPILQFISLSAVFKSIYYYNKMFMCLFFGIFFGIFSASSGTFQ